MLDAIVLPAWLHPAVGTLVLSTTLLTAAVLWYLAFRRRPTGRAGHALLLAMQAALMVQALIGIKLLDQGLGILQLYIHYVGGLAPLLFIMATYWFPAARQTSQTRNQAIASTAAFVFAFMTFTIGQAYVYRPA